MSTTTSQPMFEIQLPDRERTKGEKEYQAFLSLLPQLLASHRGQFVAIHDGQVVDSDANDITLIQRVHDHVGYVPIYVGLVEETATVARIPHFQQYRAPGDSA